MATDMKTNYKTLPDKQSGFALFLVLIMMIVIAFLVIATMQSTSMDTRTSANDSDHQFALQNAQLGIIAAEDLISSWPAQVGATGNKIVFSCNCNNGLCAAKNIQPSIANSKLATIEENCDRLEHVWLRNNVFTNTANDPSIPSSQSETRDEKKYRYVIEYLGPDKVAGVGIYLFRITSKGWGRNESTNSIVEETVQAALYDN
ncbi:pilus assembly PilX family protein [Snodgrassella gandavensis]|uniref:pilus assembly PilX family protein n=1 Tax=Snodgrassella gandavensis TaxID=2946698 RepID=UPI001EF725DE|nr:PilX N-terminal domain-containing pilus assembly protein [Snodgrassella gandavensis]